MLTLTKVSETSTKITFSWTPPPGVQWYLFYVEGVRVSNAPPVDKNGVAKTTVTFASGKNQYQVVAVTQVEGVFGLEVGTWDRTPPPPPPPSGLSWPPVGEWFSDDFDPGPQGWLYWDPLLGNSGTTVPPRITVVSDGEGGKALRLTVPAGAGGANKEASAYLGNADRGSEGVRQHGRVDFRLAPGWTPAAGVWNWIVEWHERAATTLGFATGINSCAVGVNDTGSLHIQVSGGPVTGHLYTLLDDPELLEVNRWYQLRWDHVWSGDQTKGRFRLWINERPLIDVARGTLLTANGKTDAVNNCGLYNYHPPVATDTSVDFRRFAIGPTLASIGG